MKALLIALFIVVLVCDRTEAADSTTFEAAKIAGDLTGNECKGQAHVALIPYPGDCTKYLVCEWYSGTVINCPSGLHFNPVACVCDWPTAAGCTQEGSPTQSPPSTSPTPSAIPTATPSTASTPTSTPTTLSSQKPTPGPDEDICEDRKDGTLFPYPWDCAWYIRCEQDAAVVLPCEDGWLFNPILLICDYPENVECVAIPYPTAEPTPTTTPTTKLTPTTTPTPTPSTTLTHTSTPTPTPTPTPSPVQTPTPIPTTLPNPKPTAGPDDETCNDQKDGSLFPYPWDCAWYIRCEQDAAVVLPCEDGWLFNSILLICDYPENVECVAIPYPTTKPTPTTTPTPTPSTTPTHTSTPTPTPTPTPPSVQTPTPIPTALPNPKPTAGPDDETCNDQKDGSLFPYPWDCAWYIRCEQDATVVLPCEDGWFFNPNLLICDYPENAGCVATPYPTTNPTPTSTPTTLANPTPSSMPTPTPKPTSFTLNSPVPTAGPDEDICVEQKDGTLFPYPWDCEWYIRCEDDEPIVLPCVGGWQFDSTLLTCKPPENADCTASPYPTTSVTPKPTSPSTFLPSSTPETSTGPPYVGIGICETHELGTLLPYPGKCSLYIVCEEKAPIAYACDDFSEFNDETETCEPPEEAGCSIKKTTPTSTTQTNSTTVLPTDTSPIDTTPTTTATTPSTGVGICEGYRIDDLIPYPGNCSQYIHCKLPAPIALECLDGLEFNAELQICESAEGAGCSSTTTPVPDTPSATTPTPLGLTGVCRGHELGDLIPYPSDCNKYIICDNPIPIAQKCAANLHFNDVLGICDEADTAGCSEQGSGGSSTLPSQTTTQMPNVPGLIGVCEGHQEGDLIPYPGSCTKYIRCEIPVPIAQTCKSELFFNEVLGICDTFGSIDCPSGSTTISPPATVPTSPRPPSMTGICRDHEISTLIPYPENCSKYIICDTPVPSAIACNEGLHFNADLQICDDPLAAGCDAPPSTTPSPTTAPSTSNVCCGHPIGALVPYPDDCTQYIRCEYPIPIAFSCSNGLHFNTVSERCETIEDANCPWYSAKPTTSPPLTCATLPNGSLLPYEGDCKKYYFCSGGQSVALPCPVDSIFSADEGGCVAGFNCPTTTTTTTTPAPPTCATQPNGTLLPFEGDCKKYNFCSNGASVTLPCLPGTVFSQSDNACVTGTTC